ncbi:MAG: LysM peptidoglycan-binding domain-containing protein [Chloroflexi bacterium]|nr:LysM peptidoglycan-binding domain-containing protein [Chloroflexota bacterium]
MNLTELLKFLPLIVAAYLAFHLIFKQQLPAKSLGAILTYLLGTVIVFAAISFLITTYFAGWATNLLESGTTSPAWSEFMNASEDVVEDAFSNEPLPAAAQPTVVQIQPVVVTATPSSGGLPPGAPAAAIGPTEHIVVSGDTLYGLAKKYGTTVNDIMIANGLTNYIIQLGQTLKIPAPSQ